MRKNLYVLLASLALCAAATAGVIASSARAQPGTARPMMLAMAGAGGASPLETAGPNPEGGAPPDHRHMRRGEMCRDMYAHQVGALAYLEAKLDLSSSQAPLFARWKDAKLAIAHRHADDCKNREAHMMDRKNHMPSLVDHMARREEMLKKRLADLDAERPALEALYNSLGSEQKEDFRPGGMMMGGMHRMHMFADARGPHMGMGMGMPGMGHPPMDRAGPPPGPDMPPPAP